MVAWFDDLMVLPFSGVLMCTDVMARGVDFPAVDWVIQFDPPSSARYVGVAVHLPLHDMGVCGCAPSSARCGCGCAPSSARYGCVGLCTCVSSCMRAYIFSESKCVCVCVGGVWCVHAQHECIRCVFQ